MSQDMSLLEEEHKKEKCEHRSIDKSRMFSIGQGITAWKGPSGLFCMGLPFELQIGR